jgi:hypothetical protein
MTTGGGREYDEDHPFENDIYAEFPEGRELAGDQRAGTAEGYNTYFRLNDESLFRPEALEEHPALRAFVETGTGERPISISFAQFKSSTRESEWALHKPHLTMDANRREGPEGEWLRDIDIEGGVDGFPGPHAARIGTFVVNHDVSLARWKLSVVVVEDGQQAGQMIYKHRRPESGAG